MNGVIECQCGAKIRRPAPTAMQEYRCPLCHRTLWKEGMAADEMPTAAVAAPPPLPASRGMAVAQVARVAARPAIMPPTTPASAEAAGTLCPICQTPITQGESCVTCSECGQLHHEECWAEVGGCAVYGCKMAPAIAKDPGAANEPITAAWGDTKACPVCGETIRAIAVMCRFCGTNFGTVDPLSTADLHQRHETQKSLQSIRTAVVLLFALSVIGIVAPIMAIVALAWVLPKRKQIAQAGPIYSILGYIALGLSILYSFLMVLAIAFW